MFNFVLPLLFPLVHVFKDKRCAWVFLYSSRASLTRFFCLPLAWRSFLYFFCLLCMCFCRLLLPESFCMCAVSVPFSAGLPAFTVANVESIVKSCATKLGSFPIWLKHTKLSVNKALSFALAVCQEVLVLSVYWDVSVMPRLERYPHFVTLNS